MVPLSMTLLDPDPDFKVAIIFHTEYLRNDTRYELFTTEQQQEVICAVSNGDIFNVVDRTLTRFSRSRHI